MRAGHRKVMATEDNGNSITNSAGGVLLKPNSSSNEDLSEYTDADESISAPTEFLAEFLSAVMLKDYVTALKYCKLILQYEPNNATAKEFYPLIIEKLKLVNNEEGSSNENESEDEEVSEGNSSSGTDSENSSSSDESSEGQEEEEVEIEQNGGDKQSKGSSDGDATTGSYSSLEDDEAESVDPLVALASQIQIDNANFGNGNKIYNTDLPSAAPIMKKSLFTATDNLNKNPANQFPFGTSSDSESPTDPVSQQTVAILRARVVPNKI